MSSLKNWVKEKIKNLINSRFTLGLVCLVIGCSYTYLYLEGIKYWHWVETGYAYSEIILNRPEQEPLVSQDASGLPGSQLLESQDSTGSEKPRLSSSQIVERIRQIESNNGQAGLAVTCKSRGMSNEYGYNPPNCYASHEQLTTIVEEWFDRKLKTMSLEEALELYSGDSQTYVAKFYQLER